MRAPRNRVTSPSRCTDSPASSARSESTYSRNTRTGFTASMPDSLKFSRLPTDTASFTRPGANSSMVAAAMAAGKGGHR